MFNLDIPLLNKLNEFYTSMSDQIAGFPKTKRYTLGSRIDALTIELIELVMYAGYQNRENKLETVYKVSVKLDILKMLLRMASQTKCLKNVEYQRLSGQLVEIGKMTGGWIKNLKQ